MVGKFLSGGKVVAVLMCWNDVKLRRKMHGWLLDTGLLCPHGRPRSSWLWPASLGIWDRLERYKEHIARASAPAFRNPLELRYNYSKIEPTQRTCLFSNSSTSSLREAYCRAQKFFFVDRGLPGGIITVWSHNRLPDFPANTSSEEQGCPRENEGSYLLVQGILKIS